MEQATARLEHLQRVMDVGGSILNGDDISAVCERFGVDQREAAQLARTAKVHSDTIPLELLLIEAYVEGTPRIDLIRALTSLEYTFGKVQGYDAWERGTWDVVGGAYMEGLLSEDEFKEVARYADTQRGKGRA